MEPLEETPDSWADNLSSNIIPFSLLEDLKADVKSQPEIDDPDIAMQDFEFPFCARSREIATTLGVQSHQLRDFQIRALKALAIKKDLFVGAQTGGGKSLIFLLYILYAEGCGVIVEPLVSIISDQISQLSSLGIKAIHFLPSTWNEKKLKKTKIIYLSPESYKEFVKKIRVEISIWIVDEAHCVMMWGGSFRPDYYHMGMIKSDFPGALIMVMCPDNSLVFESTKSKIKRLALHQLLQE